MPLHIPERLSASFSWIRTPTARRVVIAVLVAAVLGTVGVAAEAVARGHLVPPAARAPSALYTRPVSWAADSAREPALIGSINADLQEQRAPVELKRVPKQLVDAILSIEDQRFYGHGGLDLKRIAGAFVADLKAGGVAEGGSTITQQLAKNFYLTPSRNPVRKLREAALASVLEIRYDKDQILEAYLNEVYLGQDGGRAIHGVGAASRFYFGKPVEKLSLAESALLAGMIHAPNRVAPTRHVDDATKRRNAVLDRMVEQKRIEPAAADIARAVPVSPRSYPIVAIDARYFRDFVASSTVAKVPDRGTAIYTTLDAALQQSAERAIAKGLSRIHLPGVEAALVAIDPRTGEILAMVGGRDYGTSQFNRATDAHRQPGSAFKPIVALTALEGAATAPPRFTLASTVDDEPFQVRTSRGMWEPADYDGSFRGPVTVRHAVEQSLNIPFARIGMDIGPARIASTAERLGITSKLDAVPSLALGSSEVTLLELVRAYGVFAAEGKLADTRWILSWRDHKGAQTEGPAPSLQSVADPAAVFLVTSALQGVVQRGTARSLGGWQLRGDIAGKTGTSNNWRDAWFIAYTPRIVVGAWVGYDDGRSVRLSGGAAAVPIVGEFFADARGVPAASFTVPVGVERQEAVYTADSVYCGQPEYFLRGTGPPLPDFTQQLVSASDTTVTTAILTPQDLCAADRVRRVDSTQVRGGPLDAQASGEAGQILRLLTGRSASKTGTAAPLNAPAVFSPR